MNIIYEIDDITTEDISHAMELVGIDYDEEFHREACIRLCDKDEIDDIIMRHLREIVEEVRDGMCL